MHGNHFCCFWIFVDDGFGYSVCSNGLTPTFLSFILDITGTLTIWYYTNP